MPITSTPARKKLFTSGSLGCANAMVLFQRYVDFVLSHGYEATRKVGEADVILIDTCASTQMQEDASFGLIASESARARDDAKVIVCGCLPAINPKSFQERWRGDFFTPSNQHMLARILGLDKEEERFLTPYENPGRFMGAADAQASVLHAHVPFVRVLVRGLLEMHRLNNAFPGDPLERFPLTRRLFRVSQQCNARNYTINISQGCIGECTFCVIPKAKGRTRSLPVGLIVEKLREKIGAGVRHVTLSSDDSGAYGIDIGTDLVELLDRIDAIPGEFSLYINCFDPRWWTKLGSGMRRHLARGRIKYLQSTLQSGSNPILRRMKRAYDIDRVMPILRRLRGEFPDVVLASQFIAGFPGETEADQARSRAIIEEDIFDHLVVFDYSPRPDADSENLDQKLAPAAARAFGDRSRRAWTWSNLRIALGRRRAELPETVSPAVAEEPALALAAAAENGATACADSEANPFARV
jgi:tRNA A37 methylthiotransferase MiaB